MALTNPLKLPLKLSQRSVRILSVLAMAGLAIGFVVGAFFADPRGNMPSLFNVIRQVGLISAIVLFLDSRGRLSELDDGRLDERERGIRNRAYITTYKIVVGCLFGIILLLTMVSHMPLRQERVLGILLGLAFMVMLLPRVIIAWREPP